MSSARLDDMAANRRAHVVFQMPERIHERILLRSGPLCYGAQTCDPSNTSMHCPTFIETRGAHTRTI